MRMFVKALFAIYFFLPFTSTEARSLVAYSSSETLPEFALKDLAGKKHSLEQYKGRVVLVNFWGTWCPICVEELPSIQRLEKQLGGRGLTVLAVNVNQTRTAVNRFMKGLKLDLTVLMDTSSKVANSWGVDYYPTSFVIDKKGRVRFFMVGAADWEQAEVITPVESLIKE